MSGTMHRRNFLMQSSAAIGLQFVPFAPGVQALPIQSSRPVEKFFPEWMEAPELQALAQTAMDAARSAGAEYADIRIAARRGFTVNVQSPLHPSAVMTFDHAFGLRARVNGAWAFTTGLDPTTDSIAQASHAVVTTARNLSRVMSSSHAFAPASTAVGEWRTPPVGIDPFSVSPNDHVAVMAALIQAVDRVPGAFFPLQLEWSKETRVFASSDEAVLTQYFTAAQQPMATILHGPIGLRVPGLTPATAGFEVLLEAPLQERIAQRAEVIHQLNQLPVGTLDLGRYPVVLDGTSFGTALGTTLCPALELARAIGEEADGAGTSFLSPIHDTLGQPLFAPALTVIVDRSAPHVGQAKWDDEGVPTEPFPLIDRGVVVDYCSTRSTAAHLAPWYASRGISVTTHGGAVAWTPQRAPQGTPTTLIVPPAATEVPFAALLKEIGHGLVVYNNGTVLTDQQCRHGMFSSPATFEVKQGALVRRIAGAVVQFDSQRMWRSLTAIGDGSTLEVTSQRSFGGAPWAAIQTVMHMPAGVFTDVQVTRTPGVGE